ncbi:YkgJ family cysteine cluster protein [Natrarchaeobius chitinivorans]|uniref:YkgJ family cysteine cluster protein n=1 Tax=Natrarchaeobius chitinivorans TaxID=1679083 RepID=A0A3N6MBX6_NATCH|nr:YkgJ family cysteine cluster protein [Natrarchaeobius chitinivorans]RQG94000.1 YkgJ family cysteine cluster protein [Natrarchaeobius chitinivorans]
MEVNCEGCAGCCLDWRPLLETETRGDDGSRGRTHGENGSHGRTHDEAEVDRNPVDDDPTFVSLTRGTVRTVLEQGAVPALTPRFWHARDDRESVEIDGRRIAAVAGRPVFFLGLRKPPKPVAPFGREEPSWLPTCVFLDPSTLQCRVYDGEFFPEDCGVYPEQTLALGVETECERVEKTFGGERLVSTEVDDEPDGLLLGTGAIGEKLFCHPRPAALEGTIERLAAGELTAEDRAETAAVAAASSPGTVEISEAHYERARDRALEAATDESGGGSGVATDEDGAWIGPAIREWHRRRVAAGETVPSPSTAADVEDARGAPETPGWDDLEGE